jgi:thiol-disulfide isomerase/thioredoxin
MIIIHATTEAGANEVNKHVESGKDVFMLIYMEGCGPCNATRPEWKKLEGALQHQYKKNNRLVIATIDSKVVSSLKHAGDIIGFPTIIYLSQNGKKLEPFEASSIKDKQRNVDCFVNWVESHVGNIVSESSHRDVLKRITKRHHRGGYKRSNKRRNKRSNNKRNYKSRRSG